jgi:Domain of unknown function (DUF4826)
LDFNAQRAAAAAELLRSLARFLIVPTKDYDPAEEQEWLDEQESYALDYLDRESVAHDAELDIEWCLSPHVSVWTSPARGKTPRTWIICGDLPADFIQDKRISDARSAVRAFGARWTDVSRYMLKGELHPSIRIGAGTEPNELKRLGDLLNRRASLLLKWCEDDSVW